MRKNFKLFFKSLVISLMFCAFLVGIGYYFIEKNLTEVQKEEINIPYSQERPENVGVLLKIENDQTFIYLDFENEMIFAAVTPEEISENEIYGYSVDFKIAGNNAVLKDIVDFVGGIELNISGSTFRYTGIQIIEMYNSTNYDLKREIIKAICDKISDNGIALDFFTDIIQNTTTNLKVTDCYFWDEYFLKICSNLQIID